MGAEACIVCGVDCSRPPRAKDSQGRFLCVKCFTDRKRAALATAAPAPPADDGLSPIPLEEEPAADLLDRALAASAAVAAPRTCPNCTVIMTRDAVICTQCGFNTETGKNVGTGRGARVGKVCSKCGYSLEGLKSARCPECGTVNSPTSKRDQLRDTSKEVARKEYRKPVIMFIAGAVLAAILLGNSSSPAGAGVVYGIMLIGQSVLGIGIYVLACALGFDADSSFGLAVMRLIGVYTLFNGIWLYLGMLPFGMFAFVLALLILGGLLTNVFDYDMQDGIILALLNMGGWMAVLFTLFLLR